MTVLTGQFVLVCHSSPLYTERHLVYNILKPIYSQGHFFQLILATANQISDHDLTIGEGGGGGWAKGRLPLLHNF